MQLDNPQNNLDQHDFVLIPALSISSWVFDCLLKTFPLPACSDSDSV